MRVLLLLLSSLLFAGAFIQAEEEKEQAEEEKEQAEEEKEQAEEKKKYTSVRSKWTLENAERRTHIFSMPKDVEQRRVSAYVIPITGEIGSPQLFILRRGLKDAIANDIDVVVLEMDTPGGSVAVMLDMMKALDNFEGDTITFVNDEAMSAGALISAACKAIYMHPKSVIGAAEVVLATGEDVNESMKRKINSYMDVKVRVYTKEHRYRADIVRAMMNADYELIIDDEVIKPKNVLLSLTADEAVRKYGNPPEFLLAEGIIEDVDSLLKLRYGEYEHIVKQLELTWSEDLAKWLTAIAPLLMGIGMLLLFVEFKTPGFGVFGTLGIIVFMVVFFGSYTAGLAGYEAVIIFVIGIVLLAVELFVVPGIMIAGLLGTLMVFASLVWSMADIWPADSVWDFDITVLQSPVLKLLLAIFIAVGGAITLTRVIPRSWFWDKVVLSSAGGDSRSRKGRQRSSIVGRASAERELPPVGSRGVTVTKLFPTGEVEIDGRRYLARVKINMLETNVPIVVVEHSSFHLLVELGEEN